MKSIDERIKELPPELQKQVDEFVESLCSKQRRLKSKPTFNWAGALGDLKKSFTSVELQHRVADWRAGEK
jgi:hypothetical protein